MLSLALSLHLLGAGPALVPDLRLVPPLRLSSAQAAPDLSTAPAAPVGSAAPVAAVERPIDVRMGSVAAASAGILVGDALSLGMMLWSVCAFSESCSEDESLFVAGVVSWVFVVPAFGIHGARLAGERGSRSAGAYAVALLFRLAGLTALALAWPDTGVALFLATELLVTPYFIARILAGSPDVPGAVPASARALPVRDPALARAR